MSLAVTWVLYAVIGVSVFSAVFLWAVRAGQFRDQDRARYLPLQSPPEPGPAETENGGGPHAGL